MARITVTDDDGNITLSMDNAQSRFGSSINADLYAEIAKAVEQTGDTDVDRFFENDDIPAELRAAAERMYSGPSELKWVTVMPGGLVEATFDGPDDRFAVVELHVDYNDYRDRGADES